MAMAVQMLYFAPTVTCRCDKVGWILVSENVESSFEFVLFDVTMGGEIFT
jgi:hypothetical protein